MRLLITIDTEEDDAWGGRPAISTENILHLPRFQTLCRQYSFKPTWLCTEPILLDPRFREMMGPSVEEGLAEIGAHLHPWSCGPFPGDALPDQRVHPYPHELSAADFREKIGRITELIEGQFGRAALSYRAGRWGFRADHVPLLLERGLRIDCSVTPHISWKRHRGLPGGPGGPDFRGAASTPYWLDGRDARRPGSSGMLELPMTVLYAGAVSRRWPFLWSVADRLRQGPAGGALRRLGWAPRMFRPWPRVRLRQLLRMWQVAERLSLPYVMLMFHSSELMPGGSPYYADAPSVERLYTILERLFEALRRGGITGQTLSEFALPYFDGRAKAPGSPPSPGMSGGPSHA
jgi:hypothetical protein